MQRKNKILSLLTALLLLTLLCSCKGNGQQDTTANTTTGDPTVTTPTETTTPPVTETTPTETTIPPHDHIYLDEVIAPTCTEGGYTKHTCYICGESYTDTETAATGHHYLPEVVQPTGTEQGYTVYTCTKCEHSYRDNYTDPVSRSVIVNFDRAGGTMEGYDIRIYQTGEHADLPIPVKEGYTFLGWYLDGDDGETTRVESGLWSIVDGVTLTARWSPITVEVEFILGEAGQSLGYAYRQFVWGRTLGDLPTPTPKFGYLFDGWYDGNTRVTAETVSSYTEKVTLTARYLAPLAADTVSEDKNSYSWALCADDTLRFLAEGSFSIAEGTFAGMEGIAAVELPDTLTDIGRRAFADCINLTEITLPGSIGVIRSSVFEGCTALRSVTVGSGISVINEDAFAGCSALATLTLPQSLFQIYSPFEGCASLREVRYEGTEFQWSVIVKDASALASFSAERLTYTWNVPYEGEKN